MTRYCLTLDLKNDPALIAEYEAWHQKVWPEIIDSIKGSGITSMEIYRWETRLFMIMDTDDSFSFDKKAAMDAANLKVQEWETLMLKLQQPLPTAPDGVKWVLMNKIFDMQ
ncbi:L-rhamnose mutarotase [Mucilaginibacter limnophilus]|uniref:L-rhamnose mutarotase n=1 Tax=Mucilaginibacter limnophilus TaxID=1932778 RepID=A0A3S2WXN0_9SPHI|nr:L-rhamnose mutarotase [Mucilaginibacter limnophilus]RVU00456.1 L-rhamnose mutarotase [Mucilaginibacter limnophilus]